MLATCIFDVSFARSEHESKITLSSWEAWGILAGACRVELPKVPFELPRWPLKLLYGIRCVGSGKMTGQHNFGGHAATLDHVNLSLA